MRKLAENLYLRNGEPHFTLREALVMYDGGDVVGWAALYDAWGLDHPCASVWVWPHMRNRGYGSQLIEEMYERWNANKPEVFNTVMRVWRAMDEDRLAVTLK
jgi:GNAT superfamily N-acetyltransferase